MLGAVQLGLLAACVVLFVPMGLAGWHLSRNKVLFFSGALFITLAVGVHITPYFPSITSFVSSVSTISATDSRESCISLLHEIVYDVKSIVNSENLSNNNNNNDSASWNWDKSSLIDACEFQKLSRSDASDLLNGSWIVVAGDSQARLVVISLLNLILGQDEMDSVRLDLFKRHSNYQIVIDSIGIKLDFVWAPYTTNLTDFVVDLKRNRIYPDVIVLGAGLWHMLHITDSSNYGASLVLLKDSVNSLLPLSPESVSTRSPHIFWLGMPELINSMLNTEEKRLKMNDITLLDYERAVYRSKLLREYGGPLLLLDVKLLSQKCGILCTVDGMHYNQGVYDAAVHVMLNALLIESHQTL